MATIKKDIVVANKQHVEYVAKHMRELDRIEVRAFSGMNEEDALWLSYNMKGLTLAGLVNGIPICIFGCSEPLHLTKTAKVWMLGTDDVEKHARELVSVGREFVKAVSADGTYVYNWVMKGHKNTIPWLKRIGFTVHNDEVLIAGGREFVKFSNGGIKDV